LKCNWNSLKICGTLWDNYAYLTGQQSHFKAIQKQIVPWYIIPVEDTNKQFFLK